MTPYNSRSDLPKQNHPLVDTVLKDLKVCTRRLLTAANSQRVELQVLDQLYYKGNNQHRTALFWNRIEETRRFGKRMEKFAIYDTVESLRVSFWGPRTSVTQKSLKGAWTHVPDPKAAEFALARMKACTSLIDKMRKCLTKTYNHLNLNMQTGAFLQLILTLAGIISRLDMLLTQVRAAMKPAQESTAILLVILRAPEAPTASEATDSLDLASQVHAVALERDDSFSRQAPVTSSSVGAFKPSPVPRQHGDEETDSHLIRDTASISFKSLHEVSGASTAGRRKAIGNLEQSRRKPPGPPRGKRKKRDEIDDIFGL